MLKLLIRDQRGTSSIEAAVILPMFMFIIFGFAMLLKYMIIAEKVDNIISMSLLEYQTEGYKGYDDDELISKILIRFSENLKNYDDYIKLESNQESEHLEVVANINVDVILAKIRTKRMYKIKKITSGEKLAAYSLVNGKVYANHDIWEKMNLIRGKEIAKIFDKNLSDNNNKLDVLDGRTLISIVSTDITKKSYSTKLDIYEALEKNIKLLADFKEGRIGELKVSEEMYDKKQLLLIIPDLELNSYQEDELKIVKKKCEEQKIECKILMLGKENDE